MIRRLQGCYDLYRRFGFAELGEGALELPPA
jgi:hypothetical protein